MIRPLSFSWREDNLDVAAISEDKRNEQEKIGPSQNTKPWFLGCARRLLTQQSDCYSAHSALEARDQKKPQDLQRTRQSGPSTVP